MNADPIAAARRLDLLALMDEHAASQVSPVLAALLDRAEALRARVAELEAERQESTPIPARWDRTVILPEHPNGDSDGDTIVCCIADDGRPIGLFLNDEHREALGLLLVDPDGDTEEAA